MSTMSTEGPPAAPARSAPAAGGGNLFTRKLGPLPMWAWLAIGLALVLGYAYYKNKTSAASSSTPTGTDASQVPQFVNQTYVASSPPSAPTPTPTPTPDPGKTGGGGTGPPSRIPLKREGKGKARVGSRADLYYLAKQLGVSEQKLVDANPRLRNYEGTGKGIPSGTTINLPAGAKL